MIKYMRPVLNRWRAMSSNVEVDKKQFHELTSEERQELKEAEQLNAKKRGYDLLENVRCVRENDKDE